jgi:hypothetical protein
MKTTVTGAAGGEVTGTAYCFRTEQSCRGKCARGFNLSMQIDTKGGNATNIKTGAQGFIKGIRSDDELAAPAKVLEFRRSVSQ